jgi:putative redox protein
LTGGGTVDCIVRRISLEGELSAEQRDALLAIANKCPMYRTLQAPTCRSTAWLSRLLQRVSSNAA